MNIAIEAGMALKRKNEQMEKKRTKERKNERENKPGYVNSWTG